MRALLAAALLVVAPSVAPAFLGLSLGGQQLFFLEPVLSEQDGVFEPYLETQSPDMEFEQFEGASLGAAYGVAVQTVGEGIKARWDRYRVRAGFTPGPVKLMGKRLRLGFGVDTGAEAFFLRHFPNATQAVKAVPLAPWVLGSTESLLEHMRPGDLASLPVRAELLLRAAFDTPIAGIPARPSIFAKLSGLFQVTLVRLPGQRVRLRFRGLKSKTAGLGFKAGLLWDLELFELLGKSVEALAAFDMVKTSWTKKWGDGLLLDATLDLAHPKARAAFEALFYKPLKFATGEGGLLSAGFAMIQDIAARGVEPDEAPAVLHRCGLLEFQQDAWRLKLGNSLLRWGRKELSTLLEFEPYRQKAGGILMASNLSAGKTTVLFRRTGKWFHESRAFATRGPWGLTTGLWTLRYRVKDLKFSQGDLEHLRKHMRFYLGDLAPELPDLPAEGRTRAKADVRLRFSRRALEEVAKIPVEELESRFDAWIDEADPGMLWRQSHPLSFLSAPRELKKALVAALRGRDPGALRDLADLRSKNRAFGDLGPGFLLSLLRPRPDDDRLSVYIRYKALHPEAEKVNLKIRHGGVEAAEAEGLAPVMRFLETGILELQAEAASVALEEWARQAEAAERFQQVHRDS